ncbi:MAG TPA: VanW family protein [Chloroflexota bacterium]|jgi:hypothetical protein
MGSARAARSLPRRRFLLLAGTALGALAGGCAPATPQTAPAPRTAPSVGDPASGARSAIGVVTPTAAPRLEAVRPTATAVVAPSGPAVVSVPTVEAPRNQVQPGTTLTASAPTPGPQATPATAPRPEASPTPTAPPPPPTATPKVYDAARLKDVLGAARTSYAGSIPARKWNIELAVERLDGTIVGPGELFSFNRAVGPTTLGAGFRIGYGITMQGGGPQTIPSVAGGICQVATTVFQAAFWAGLPFVERHYHLYWIPRYGKAPSGRTGLDATVDDPGVDLKFRNTTDDWVRLVGKTDGENVYFEIKGIDPGWAIEVGEPRVYDRVRTIRDVVRREDTSLPPGQELEVEHAEDGFRMALTRLVKLKDEVVDQYSFTNFYRPARTVVLVGVRRLSRPAAPVAATSEAAEPAPAAPPAGSTSEAPAPSAPTPPPRPAAPPAAAAQAPPGQARVPSLVGLSEAAARAAIDAAGLSNTYTNYQGPGQVPGPVLESVPPGHVLSQTPGPGALAPAGSKVYLAVRRQ